MSGVKKVPLVGDTVRIYRESKKLLCGEVTTIYATPVEGVKLYEIRDTAGKLHYATLDCIARISQPGL